MARIGSRVASAAALIILAGGCEAGGEEDPTAGASSDSAYSEQIEAAIGWGDYCEVFQTAAVQEFAGTAEIEVGDEAVELKNEDLAETGDIEWRAEFNAVCAGALLGETGSGYNLQVNMRGFLDEEDAQEFFASRAGAIGTQASGSHEIHHETSSSFSAIDAVGTSDILAAAVSGFYVLTVQLTYDAVDPSLDCSGEDAPCPPTAEEAADWVEQEYIPVVQASIATRLEEG